MHGIEKRHKKRAIGDSKKTDASLAGLLGRVRSHDPTEAFKETAKAGFEEIRTPLAESIESLRSEQVGRGRLNSGFGFQDEDRLVRDIYTNYLNRLSSSALAAEQLRLQGYGLEGDIISGQLDRKTAEQNAGRHRKGALFGALGAGAGWLLGGPAGGYLGSLLGNQVGQSI